MAEYRLGRSEYRFDPTAIEATARVDRKMSRTSTVVLKPPKLYQGRMTKQIALTHLNSRFPEERKKPWGLRNPEFNRLRDEIMKGNTLPVPTEVDMGDKS